MINAVGRELPEKVGSYVVKPYAGYQEVIEADETVEYKEHIIIGVDEGDFEKTMDAIYREFVK